jgi:hypothetical protein
MQLPPQIGEAADVIRSGGVARRFYKVVGPHPIVKNHYSRVELIEEVFRGFDWPLRIRLRQAGTSDSEDHHLLVKLVCARVGASALNREMAS